MNEEHLRALIISKLELVKDPEFDYNIIELGLVYSINIDVEKRQAYIKMTLTTPFCPYGNSIIGDVQRRLEEITELDNIDLDIVFEPEWKPEYMEEEPKRKLLEEGVFKNSPS